MIIKQLPQMASVVSKALSKAKDVSFISTGGQDVGAARLTGEVVNVMGQITPLVRNMTGIDVPKSIAAMRAQEA